ncbi:hypothetical protein [Streptacidiphilus cavernicola]|uniref:Bacterial spore germination immunoglobulin-like domain-containing protein n=1 Tax=Streptacidiphilus cavernicola TaxID=3342716 RepID=A0ABV6W4V3_9ACTN
MSAFRTALTRTAPALAACAALLLAAGCAAQPASAPAAQDAASSGANAAGSNTAARAAAAAAATTADPATGLDASADGYWLVSATPEPTAVRSVDYRFQVLAPDGSAVTSFLGGADTARVYAVRSDLTGLRRTVPVDLGEGVWSAQLGELDPGQWRIYVAFTPNSNPGPTGLPPRLLLSRTLLVPGTPEISPLDPASPTASVDGLLVRLTGQAVAGRPAVLRMSVSRPTVQGVPPMTRTVNVPVNTLEPLDGGYGQLTGVHAADQALAPFTALTPAVGMTGGPSAEFRGTFRSAGDWRVFVQFRTDGQDHTAMFTVPVRSR